MAAGAAPVVPEAGLGVAAIATALGWLVLACVLWAYRRGLGRLILYAADRFDALAISIPHVTTVRPLGPIAAALRYVHKQVDHALAEAMLACEKATVYLLHAMYNLLVWTAREIADLAATTEQALGLQRAADVPKLIGAALGPVRVAVRAAVRAAHAAELHADALYGRARGGIDKLRRDLTRTIGKQVARVTSRVGTLERAVGSRAWWKRHLTGTLGIAAFSALVATALGRLGLRWLRCGNVKKTGQAVCGMNGNLLDALLLGVLAVEGPLSLVETAEDLQDVIGAVFDGLAAVVSEVGE